MINFIVIYSIAFLFFIMYNMSRAEGLQKMSVLKLFFRRKERDILHR